MAIITDDNGVVLVPAKGKMSPAYSVQQQRKAVKHNPIVAKALKVEVHARIRGEYNKRQVEPIIVQNKFYYIKKGFARRPPKMAVVASYSQSSCPLFNNFIPLQIAETN